MLSGNRFRHFLCAAALLIAVCAQARVKPGIEVLRDRGFSGLSGMRVGLVTNPSGVDSQLNSTIDILYGAPGVELVALFAPEHGVRGDIYAGGKVESGRDPRTGETIEIRETSTVAFRPGKVMKEAIAKQ